MNTMRMTRGMNSTTATTARKATQTIQKKKANGPIDTSFRGWFYTLGETRFGPGGPASFFDRPYQRNSVGGRFLGGSGHASRSRCIPPHSPRTDQPGQLSSEVVRMCLWLGNRWPTNEVPKSPRLMPRERFGLPEKVYCRVISDHSY